MAAASGLGSIIARHDRDCIDRAKFRCELPAPLPADIFDYFLGTKIVVRHFSRMVPLGKDLFSIVRERAFRIDGILGDKKLIVIFDRQWPRDLMDEVAQALTAAGYRSMEYVDGISPRCAECAVRFSKGCNGRDEALP